VKGSPHVIVADTVKGKGVARMELDVDWHVGSLGPADYAAVEAELLGTVL
jgi:transketolase